jgi:hypothetical protein
VRKGLILAFVIFVVAGGIGVVALRPGEASVEHHLRGYKAAQERLEPKRTFVARARQLWREIRAQPQGRHEDWRDLMEHERALVGLGYLEERVFILSNVPLSHVSSAVTSAVRTKSTNLAFFRGTGIGPNGIKVVTRKGNMPAVEEVKDELAARTNR